MERRAPSHPVDSLQSEFDGCCSPSRLLLEVHVRQRLTVRRSRGRFRPTERGAAKAKRARTLLAAATGINKAARLVGHLPRAEPPTPGSKHHAITSSSGRPCGAWREAAGLGRSLYLPCQNRPP